MTVETLKLLRELLGQVSIQVGAPDFEDAAQALAKAKIELDEALAQTIAAG